MTDPRPSNRLARETSPYLLQHAHNPVDWYPWGDEAFAAARARGVPVLLSVGYAACHWCHVMERESFEDTGIAGQMNAEFVNVKVDREERPDVDELYMRAVQAFTGGRGGWPMTVFLTPDGLPFFGGTYFPPERRHGMPGFGDVLAHVSRLWRERGDDVAETTAELRRLLEEGGRLPAPVPEDDDWLARVVDACEREFDGEHGGFGGAPKFPPHGALAALLAAWSRSGDPYTLDMAMRTLDGMALGGMYDVVGGGFARYSVDAEWRVPHFEKMLYDNAQLVPLYVDAWRAARQPRHREVVEETLGWMLRELQDGHGGFVSSFDADSGGEEGTYYTWTPSELREAVGDADARRVARLLEVTEEGTFEHGRSVIRLRGAVSGHPDEALLRRALAALRAHRERRVAPVRDTKVVASWNALAIRAFARAASAFDVPEWRGAAARCGRFVLDRLVVDGRLRRSCKDGRATVLAFADDHALLVQALVDLWECTFDPAWLTAANEWADRTTDLFWDEAGGALWYTGRDAPPLVARSRNLLGGAEPSANGVAAMAFARLAALCGREDLGAKADRILLGFAPYLARAPRAVAAEAVARAFRAGPVVQVGVVGGHAEALLDEARARSTPFTVLAWIPDASVQGEGRSLLPWMSHKHADGGLATAYVCEGETCLLPTTQPAMLGAQLDDRRARPIRVGGSEPRPLAPPLPSSPECWHNVVAPVSIEDLRGEVTVVAFWTYGCVRCQHLVAELDALTVATGHEPVPIIGVHTGRFPAERERDNVRSALRRLRVRWPLTQDPHGAARSDWGVTQVPAVVLLDAEGRIAWRGVGELRHEELARVVGRLRAERPSEAEPPPVVRPEGERGVKVDPGLFMPGALAVSGDANGAPARLFVADTGNHRIVELALSIGADGWPSTTRLRVFGGGEGGLADGPVASFRSPQGLAPAGRTLWVSDTGNHALRAIDLHSGETRTVAGTGKLGRGQTVDGSRPLAVPLRSPWGVAVAASQDGEAEAVFVAMAGSNQIWAYLADSGRVGPLAGSGRSGHRDGAPADAQFAQPCGLWRMGRHLFAVDAESSSVRAFDLTERRVVSVLGAGVDDYGDHDGPTDEARLQHPVAVTGAPGSLWIADTYNGKIKQVDLRTNVVWTVADGLHEPSGIARFGRFVLVADTNAHRVVALDPTTGTQRELLLTT